MFHLFLQCLLASVSDIPVLGSMVISGFGPTEHRWALPGNYRDFIVVMVFNSFFGELR